MQVGPAGGIVVMSLDFHIADMVSHNGNVCVCVCPRSQEENGGEWMVVWPSPLGSDFSLSRSLSLSSKFMHSVAKTSYKTKELYLLICVYYFCEAIKEQL